MSTIPPRTRREPIQSARIYRRRFLLAFTPSSIPDTCCLKIGRRAFNLGGFTDAGSSSALIPDNDSNWCVRFISDRGLLFMFRPIYAGIIRAAAPAAQANPNPNPSKPIPDEFWCIAENTFLLAMDARVSRAAVSVPKCKILPAPSRMIEPRTGHLAPEQYSQRPPANPTPSRSPSLAWRTNRNRNHEFRATARLRAPWDAGADADSNFREEDRSRVLAR
ncbi:hypothetical protein B0H16DRAFT_1789985 [Mycena metata]|uniref:Uncharacterized protein n=1 Tax=Mycena metata TaxID=1033252 RepID=A0AAD7MLA3_9AGAR|nr:hypothetical protein B0H16DRAFT_1789985 [Mycena metata]